MAVYKVPQNVEADDKLLGPFSFKQFIFLLVGLMLAYISFALWSIYFILGIIPAPFSAFLIFLAVYQRKDQPMETFLIAKVRFMFKPRTRLWDKDGIIERVHINVPKKLVVEYSDGRSVEEIRSSLKSLAQVMDTRGWSVKNIDGQTSDSDYGQSVYASDRVYTPAQTYQEPNDVHSSDDVMDSSSQVYQNFSQLSQENTNNIRQQAIQNMTAVTQQMSNQPNSYESSSSYEEKEDLNSTNSQTTSKETKDHLQEVDDQEPKQKNEEIKSTSTMTQSVPPDIINLSQDNNRSVSSIAKEADDILHDNESISLH